MSDINHFENLIASEVYKTSSVVEKMSMLKDLKHESYYSGADANYEFYKLFDELKAIVDRGDEIKNNWENNCYQEATHYNWLDDQIHEKDQLIFNLQTENQELREALDWATSIQLKACYHMEKAQEIRAKFNLDKERGRYE